MFITPQNSKFLLNQMHTHIHTYLFNHNADYRKTIFLFHFAFLFSRSKWHGSGLCQYSLGYFVYQKLRTFDVCYVHLGFKNDLLFRSSGKWVLWMCCLGVFWGWPSWSVLTYINIPFWYKAYHCLLGFWLLYF